jgi:hypothetical protein
LEVIFSPHPRARQPIEQFGNGLRDFTAHDFPENAFDRSFVVGRIIRFAD